MTKFKKIALSVGSAVSAMQLAAMNAYAITPIQTGTGWFTDIGVLINSVLRVVMVIAALLVFMYLILGGIEWITSGGDKGKTEKAREKITAAIVGLIVLAAAYAILTLVLKFLGFNSLDQVIQEGING